VKNVRGGVLVLCTVLLAIGISACGLSGVGGILILSGTGTTVTFSAKGIPINPNEIITFKWLFGDGSMAQGVVVTHRYPGGGTYDVTLVVVSTSPGGQEVHKYFYKTITVQSQIVFIEEDPNTNEDELFVIDSDGLNLVQITPTVELDVVDMDEVDMNVFGQIVYSCELPAPPPGADDDQICAINIDGTENRVLTSRPHRSDNPRINDLGQVVYICEDASTDPHICTVDLDGNNQKRITSGIAEFDPEINNLGQIAYNCIDSFLFEQICAINFNGSGQRQLTNDSFDVFDPEINDLSRIAFVCPDAGFDAEICQIDFNGSRLTQLTDSDCCTDFFDPEMNQFGNIAFACDFLGPPPPPSPGSSPLQKCVINTDGSGFRVTPDNVYLIDSHEYSGTNIVAACSQDFFATVDLCLFDDKAMSFTVLFANLIDLEDFAIR